MSALRRGAFAAVLPVVACSKTTPSDAPAASATPAAASAPATAAAGSSPCNVVTPAEAAAALGIASLSAPDVQSVPPVTICRFSDGKRPGALTLRFEVGRDLAGMAIIRKGHDENGQKTTDLPGLGDTAFTTSLSGLNEVSFLGKGTVVLVMGRFPHEQLTGLGRTILSRL